MQRIFHLHTLVFLATLGVAPLTVAAAFPKDVGRFIERRDAYDHFRGEPGYDEERREFLHKNITRYCTGTDKQLGQLKRKYKKNSTVITKLDPYESNIAAP